MLMGFVGMISIGDKNFRGTGDKVNIRWEFGGEDNKNYDFSYTRPWIDSKETTATINLYDITNEYADYNIDGDEIARYDKKRRGQELTFSRKTDNEFISNYVTLKNRDDIYKGEETATKATAINTTKMDSKRMKTITKIGCRPTTRIAVTRTSA